MARQSFISNLGGYALKKLRLLVNGSAHEYDTTQPVEVSVTSGKQINMVSTNGSVDIDENSTAQSVTFDLSVDTTSDFVVIGYDSLTFSAVQTALNNGKLPRVSRTTAGITVYHDLIVSSTVTNEFLFRSGPAKDGGFAEIRVFNDNTKSYTTKDIIHNCVQVDAAQTFTDAEKARARANIGVTTAAGSYLLTSPSDWQTLTGTDVTLRNVWPNSTPETVTGDKIRLGINSGQTKYHVEMAKLGAYRFDVILHVKWDGTPVNKTGTIFGIAVDFSRPFETIIGRQSTVIKVSGTEHAYYSFSFEVSASSIDAPTGVKLAIQVLAEYLGPILAAEVT